MPNGKKILMIHKGEKVLMEKPNFEDVIPDYLESGYMEAALGFAGFLRENNFIARLSTTNTETWKAAHKSKIICTVHLKSWTKDAKWLIVPHLDNLHKYAEQVFGEGLQDTVWNGIVICNGCPPSKGGRRSVNRPCIGGRDGTILGRDFKGICVNIPLTRVWDPNETEISIIKRLLELEKQARENDGK